MDWPDRDPIVASHTARSSVRLGRALYTCDRLGIDPVGVSADRWRYCLSRYWWWRELAAVTQAWLDLSLVHPTLELREKLPID